MGEVLRAKTLHRDFRYAGMHLTSPFCTPQTGKALTALGLNWTERESTCNRKVRLTREDMRGRASANTEANVGAKVSCYGYRSDWREITEFPWSESIEPWNVRNLFQDLKIPRTVNSSQKIHQVSGGRVLLKER